VRNDTMNAKEMIKKYKGLLKKRPGYHFLDYSDLVQYFINEHYSDTVVIAIYNSQTEFDRLTRLYMLKRDDFTSYMIGKDSDVSLVMFETKDKATDWVYNFPTLPGLKWELYENGKLTLNQDGKINGQN
jgi:hypothetical protein